MKTHLLVLLLAATTLSFQGGFAEAAVLLSEDFENLSGNVGSNLTGLDGWGVYFGQSGLVATGVGANTSTIISTPSPSLDNTGNTKDYGNFGLVSGDRISLQFDIRAGNTGADIASLSFGNASATQPGPFVGGAFGSFILRETGYGTQHIAKKPDNSNFQPVAGTWYRVYSEWDLGAKTGNMLVQDLSGTDPNVADGSFQQLFFNQAQTDSTPSLGALANLANWSQARVRLGGAGGVGDIDNLHVETVDTVALYAFLSPESALNRASTDPEPNSTATDFAMGPGISGLGKSSLGNPPNSAHMSGSLLDAENETQAIQNGDYLTFTVTPDSGYLLSASSLSFDFQRDLETSPLEFALYADEDPGPGGDNFATRLGGGTFGTIVGVSNNNFFNYSVVLGDVPFLQDVWDTTAFHLYLWGAESADGGSRIDNVALRGNLSLVPEPATLFVWALLAGLGIVAGWRRRKS